MIKLISDVFEDQGEEVVSLGISEKPWMCSVQRLGRIVQTCVSFKVIETLIIKRRDNKLQYRENKCR